MKLPNTHRISQILSFINLSSSPNEKAKLAVLGFARGHPFSYTDIISKIGRYLFNLIIINLKGFKNIKIAIDPKDLGHLISFEEVFIDKCYDLTLVPFIPEIILDCGAHIGLFSLLAFQKYPNAQITAFEPNPENVHMIREQIKINQSQINLVEVAVSIENGEAWFHADYSNTGSLCRDNQITVNSYKVNKIDLVKYVSQFKSKSLLLKMDVEGEELKLLPALAPHLPHQCAIFFEFHGTATNWEEITQALAMEGFQIQKNRSRKSFIDAFALRA